MYYERLHSNKYNVQTFCDDEDIIVNPPSTEPPIIVQEAKPHLLVELPNNDYSIFLNGDIANIFLEIGNTSKFIFNDISYNFNFKETNFFNISFQARNITRTFLDDNTLHLNNVPYLNANYIYPTITNDNGDIINNIPNEIIEKIGIYNLTYNLIDPSSNAESIIIIKLNIIDTQPISIIFDYGGIETIELFNDQSANLLHLEKLVTENVNNSFNKNIYNNWNTFITFRNSNFLGRTSDNDPCFNNIELHPSNINFFNTDNSLNHYWEYDLSINEVNSNKKGIFYIHYNLENNSGNPANDLSCTLIQEVKDELPQILIDGFTNNFNVNINQYLTFTIPTMNNGKITTVNGDNNPVNYITDPEFYNTIDISQGGQTFNFIYTLQDNAGNSTIFTIPLVVIDLLPKIIVRYGNINYNNDFTRTIDQYANFILPDENNGKVSATNNDDNPITKTILYTNELSDSNLVTFYVSDISNTYIPGKYIITYSTFDNQDNSTNLIFTLIITNRDPELTVTPTSITKNRITGNFSESEISITLNYYQRNELIKTYQTISGGDGSVFNGSNINPNVLGHYRIIYSIDNYNPYNYPPLGIESITKTVDIHFVDNTRPQLEITFWDGFIRIFTHLEVYNKNINQSYIKENISEDFTPIVSMVYDQTTGPSGEHPELISDVQITSDPTYNIGETRKETYTFTYYLPDDGFGNSTTVTINLIIVDDIFPILTLGSSLNFNGISTPFKTLSLNDNSQIFTYITNIIDISESLVKEIGYYQLPDATAIDYSGIDLSVNIPHLSGAITPKNSIIEAVYSAIDSANNKTIVNFRYKINDNIFPSFTEISYDINNTGSFTNYNHGDLIKLDEFLHVYIKFTVNEVVNFSIYDSSGNFSFIDSNQGVTVTNLKLNDTSPGDYNIIIQADDGVNQTLSTIVLIRINPIPYFTFRIENNGTDNILQVRYKTYIKDGITYNYLNTLTIQFESSITNIDLITPAGILINVDGNDGKNFFINNIGTKRISISTSTIVGNALFTNYNDGIFMDLINIGNNDVNIDEILTLFIFDSKDLISGRSFYYIENGSLNAIQDVSILNLINNQIIKNRNINEVYNSQFSNLPNQLIFFHEDYINNFGVGYVDICNNPQTFFDATYNRWFYETLNWANEVSGSSQPPTIQDYHIDHGDGDIIIQSRYKLIPGIINGDQDLGDGLPFAMNIFDASECILYDLTVKDLDNNILFNIDQSDNIYISCLPDSSYQNMQIWTILFNIFDVSGWLLLANQDVELNIINNYGYDSNSNFDISLSKIEISGNSSISNDKFLLECSQNILSLKTSDIGTNISGQIVDNIYFNIKDDNGNILDSSMIYLHLTPFTGYELGLGDSSFNFIIKKTDHSNTTNLIIRNEKQVFAKIFPYGYNILQNVSYFNINNITIEENNLLKLDTSGVLIGKLNFLSS